MGPLISLIVPFYNVAEKVIPCLQSIFCQTYTNYEIVLIDDGSTDNSAKIVENAIKEHDRCYLISTTHRGVSHARNCGVEYSKGEYLAFIDADDIITSDYLEKLILPMCRDESIDICACGAIRMRAKGDFDSLLDWKKEGYILPGEALEKLFAPASIENLWGKIHRRELCLKYQLDERFSYGEDLLASWYFINSSRKLYYIPSNNYIYNLNSSGACQGMPILKRFFNILNVLKNIQLSQFYLQADTSIKISLYRQFIKEYLVSMKLCITDTSLMYRDDILNFHNNEQMMMLQALKTILRGCSNIQKIEFVYDYLMNKNDFLRDKECVIYGAGENAISLYNVLCKKNENVTSFVVSDSYKCKRGKLLNLPVYSKECLLRKNENVILIIAVSFPSCLEIFRNIEDSNFYKILLW